MPDWLQKVRTVWFRQLVYWVFERNSTSPVPHAEKQDPNPWGESSFDVSLVQISVRDSDPVTLAFT